MANRKPLWSRSESDHHHVFFQEEEEDLFSVLSPSLSNNYNSFTNPFKDFQIQPWISSQDAIDNHIYTSYVPDDHMFMALPYIEPITTFSQGDVLSGTWNENTCNYIKQVEPIRDEISRANSIGCSNMEIVLHEENNTVKKTTSQKKRYRDDGVIKALTKETLKQFYYIPITKAAKELNVGLTVLKKRCREVGIPRWPHRKLKSLLALEANIMESWKKDGEMSKSKARDALEILEMERKMIEEDPDLEFGVKIKRLRQACFKASYKRRRFLLPTSTTSSVSSKQELVYRKRKI